MAQRAAAVGANFFAGNPLFLKPCSRPTYFGFLHEQFPELVAEYEKRFGTADFATPEYSRKMAGLVRKACERHGLLQRYHDALLTRDPETYAGSLSPLNATSERRPPGRAGEVRQQRLFA
jgi:hypothetical protein